MADRMIPPMTDLNKGFWEGGADGKLRIRRCQACSYWMHPPYPRCPRCHSEAARWETVTGTGTIFTFTVNRRAWNPETPVPYVVAMVELPEQPGLLLTTNIVEYDPDAISIGMEVEVCFDHQETVFVPVFRPI